MPNLSLFPEMELFGKAEREEPREIPAGLSYHADFIDAAEEAELLSAVECEAWSYQWQRRTQFYGKRYKPGTIEESYPVALPLWSEVVSRRLVDAGILSALPNQIGVNEYLPGQGIAAHVDYMGGMVVSLSLGSDCVMDFTKIDSAAYSMLLQRRSIVVLQGDARNIWKHGIARRKSDIIDGQSQVRVRRVSITFRDVK